MPQNLTARSARMPVEPAIIRTMEYKKLTDEHKSALLENTLLQIEQEHYANVLALKRAEASGQEDQAKRFKDEIASLEKQAAAFH